MKQLYNKLVRDKIPNIIKNNGGEPYTRILSNDEYIENLKKKLIEECNEVVSAKAKEDTLEELAERSGIAPRTLSNIKNDTSHNMKLESVVAICLGLRLPPELSFDLIEASGLSFRIANPNEAMYKHILYAPDDWDVGKWNEKLLKANLKPLNKLRAG